MSRYAHNLSSASSSVVATAILTLAAVFAAVGTPAFGGPVYFSSGSAPFVGTSITIPQIAEEGDPAPALSPTLSNTGTGASVPATINLLGTGTYSASINRAGSNSQGTVGRDSKLDFEVFGNVTDGSRNNGLDVVTKGYAITGLSYNFSGLASYTPNLTSPLAAGSYQVTLGYGLFITEVDFQSIAPKPVPFELLTSGSFAGNTNASENWNLSGPIQGAISWNAFKASLGLTAQQNITGIQFGTLDTNLSAVATRSTVTNTASAFELTASTELVAVPEPPTVILAGLGVFAIVANGYRRRKLLQRDDEGSEGEWTAEESAIGLTA